MSGGTHQSPEDHGSGGPRGDGPGREDNGRDGPGRFEPDPPSWLAVTLGVLAGFAASFFLPLMLFPLLDGLSLSQNQAAMPVVMFALPVLGLLALLVPAWRRSAAGFVMGLSIGAIVFGGVCATVLSSFGW